MLSAFPPWLLLFQAAGQGVRYVYQFCKPSSDRDDLENAVVEDGNDGGGGSEGAGALGGEPAPPKVV